MAVCGSLPWDMTLLAPSGGAAIATPLFRSVSVINGKITGKVHHPFGTIISDLTGTCVSLPLTNSALMSFKFRLRDAGNEIAIFYCGIGFIESGAFARFEGHWIAYPVAADTPAALADAKLVLPGSGDTGTGTGNQT
jgi:hypothetical protein